MNCAGTKGGLVPCKELPYAAPTRTGSTNGPGLGGTNHGVAGSQGPSSPTHAPSGGSPVPWINRK